MLLAATGLVWLSAIGWIYLGTRSEVERVLDARLMESARMVSSLVASREVAPHLEAGPAADGSELPWKRLGAPDRQQLSCQIWTFDGVLVARSDSAPAGPLGEHRAGFTETVVDGKLWRVFAVENEQLGLRVLVGDQMSVRDGLVGDVIKGLVLPASLVMPLLAALIWLSVGRGLAPLDRVAASLRERSAADLSPLPEHAPAAEIRPLIRSLNGLFARVAGARERERNFTAYAAHELRTPLAGLKTQVQIALASDEEAVRRKALEQVVRAVDRTSRLVRQLLDTAETEARQPEPGGEVRLADAFAMLAADLQGARGTAVRVTVEPALVGAGLAMQPALFLLAARNLLENALAHSPDGGTVRCGLRLAGGQARITIEDEGRGMDEAELARATERFFRGRHRAGPGSGLGLSIAELALERGGASLRLANRREGGLRAEIRVPHHRLHAAPGQEHAAD
ncbi:sensor histidine kinase N-terminal domain-containing protein [Geminicoccaceae bacterium 1502E]|nr:sensor histidine kinase N-terminal domain-containing protein [Geminicoccaceae bacterium 1502E]